VNFSTANVTPPASKITPQTTTMSQGRKFEELPGSVGETGGEGPTTVVDGGEVGAVPAGEATGRDADAMERLVTVASVFDGGAAGPACACAGRPADGRGEFGADAVPAGGAGTGATVVAGLICNVKRQRGHWSNLPAQFSGVRKGF
jgi:hypothetical protein